MSTDNPFRQRLRRADVSFKTWLREADARGRDAGGNTDFAVGRDYLWIAFDFSVPLRWIQNVGPVGPGFTVVWRNAITGSEEQAFFCVLRTGWGYNTKKRDKVVALVREAISKSSALPPQRTVTAAEVLPSCEKCGELSPEVYDLSWFTSVIMYAIRKSDRRVLCRSHGAVRVRIVTVYNLTFGNLGIGLLASPVISYRNINAGKQNGAIGRVEAAVWMVLVTWPYLLVAAALASVVRFVVTF
jgi:hypothetical protein